MNRLLSGLVLSAVLATPVMAADLPARMPVKAPPPIVTVYSWTGCYIGGHAGWAWGDKNIERVAGNPLAASYNHNVDGFLIGGQIGCNVWQRDRWVLGIEAQVSWTDLNGSAAFDPNITAQTSGFKTDADWMGSIAGRLGYAFGATGQTLIFVKGGAAFIHESFQATSPIAALTYSDSKDLRWGWMVGGGFEHALSGPWSIKGEYNYNDFGTQTRSLCTPLAVCEDYRIRQHIHVVKFGINYRWGAGPVVARY